MIRELRMRHNFLSKFIAFIAVFTAVGVICMCKYNVRLSVDEYSSYQCYAVGDISIMEVHFIDVGQGDCTLITCDGEAMLIDAGGNSKGTAIQMYLMKHDIDRLEYVIGTHPDEDHIGGLDVIITKFDCDMIMMPDCENGSASYRDLKDATEYKNYTVTSPVPGDSYSIGSAEFTIIAPNGQYEGTNNNSNSIVWRLYFYFQGEKYRCTGRNFFNWFPAVL